MLTDKEIKELRELYEAANKGTLNAKMLKRAQELTKKKFDIEVDNL